MNEIKLESLEHLHNVFNEYRSNTYKFRGQSDESWKLIPKAGRDNFSKYDDKLIFRQWKRRAKFYLKNNFDNWEYLCIAQHYGLPTRLLDWSQNPLVACFFSSSENLNKNGVIYIIKVQSFIQIDNVDPFEIEEDIIFYQPNTSSERLANQYGYFSVHKNPKNIYENDELTKLIIPKELKSDIINMLNQYGTNFLSLFPDLEGLSRHLSWFYNLPYLNSKG